MRVITLLNQKGGTGKTTTAVNVGAALSLRGFKCLLVDIDPQGSLSSSCGYRNLGDDVTTIYEVLNGASINKAIIKGSHTYDIIPSDMRLASAEIELADSANNYLLRNALKKVDYDYVIIDSPPSFNILSMMALTASTDVIIPLQAQYLPLRGVAQLRDTIELVKERFNPDLNIGGIVLTFYDQRRLLDREVLEALEQSFAGKVFKTKISHNIKLAEAPSAGVDVLEYSPTSRGAIQYKALAEEIINMKPQEREND